MTDGQGKPLSDAQMREQRLQRNLKIVGVVLGALILAALAAIVAKIALMATSPKQGAGAIATSVTPPAGMTAGSIRLAVPTGSRVVSTSMSGNRLAVHHEGPTGSGISVIDLDSGARIADVTLVPVLPGH